MHRVFVKKLVGYTLQTPSAFVEDDPQHDRVIELVGSIFKGVVNYAMLCHAGR